MEKLKTTTWKYRNTAKLRRLEKAVSDFGLVEPTIIEVGPGGLTSALFSYFPQGSHEQWSEYDKFKRFFLKILEDAIRKAGLYGTLQNSEPIEIADLFAKFSPRSITIVDYRQEVIKAAAQAIEARGLQGLFGFELADITTQKIPSGDIVIAYNVVHVTSNPQKSLENIAGSVNTGGLLSINTKFSLPGFTRLDADVYLREF